MRQTSQTSLHKGISPKPNQSYRPRRQREKVMLEAELRDIARCLSRIEEALQSDQGRLDDEEAIAA